MEESYSESDVSLSPSQILQRLQVLRQLQLMQRGKLQKQQLQYKESSETSSNYTDIVSHFSSSASYNTFCSLLQSSNDISNECTPRIHTSDYSQKVQEKDLIDGISVLNLSQESEFIVTSPLSGRSKVSESSKRPEINHDDEHQGQSKGSAAPTGSNSVKSVVRNQIALDEMPILSPKQNFEAILLERLQKEKSVLSEKSPQNTLLSKNISKKPFLRKGEGTARFGVKKNAIVIQNTQSLPWRRKSFQNKPNDSPLKQTIINKKSEKSNPDNSELIIPDIKIGSLTRKNKHQNLTNGKDETDRQVTTDQHTCSVNPKPTNKQTPIELPSSKTLQNLRPMQAAQKIEFAKSKHPLITNKGKTWASVLTKEQNDFLSQLKQSDYYKNFNSPSKSIISDASCDEMSNVKLQRETAEQNMFELLENKVNHESFNLENSFFNRFLKRSNLECSGESTPLVMQKCLSNNPGLMHLGLKDRKRNEDSQSDAETCCSNYSDCCSDSCSTASCCSCKTVEETSNSIQKSNKNSDKSKKSSIKNTKKVTINQNEDNDDTITDNDIMKANMAEMNAKLVSTSELLKERLCELEDEIETFRKENAGIAKLREEIDQDRQKFYEEKAAFEQKFNEDKVLSEYYLAEEKEKLSKQKQIYDRYVKEMRGRLNKKDKDEVVNLKKEISDLKEEIRIKDAKSTSTIARLRNQIKIMEKEKKDLHDEVEKFKKQNKRIQHSNEVTRRLTNIKYLEEINKKLTNMSSKDSKTEVSVDRDAKYKAYEIERQSRKRTVDQAPKGALRLRAKSVPNLNVTSRYAKYFSQRDTASQDPKEFNIEPLNLSDVEDDDKREHNDTLSNRSLSEDVSEDENYLEKIYAERFKSNSPKSNRSSGSNLNFSYNFVDKHQLNENTKEFFMQKSNPGSSRSSKSPKRTISPNDRGLNRSKSPASSYNNKSQSIHNSATRYSDNSLNRSSSPISVFNHSSLRSNTVIQNDKLLNASPEPAVKRPVNKTSLNPTEYRNSDGSRELRFPEGNVKYISADSKYSKFVYYNGDVKENFYSEGRIKYFYAETKTYHTTHADGLEILEFPDGQVEKRYKDGSSEIRLPNGSIRYFDPKNVHVREEWRFPDGAALTVAASGERRVVFSNKQVEVHAKDHKRREFPDGTVKLLYNDGTSETRYASGRIRIKDKHGNLIMDSAPD